MRLGLPGSLEAGAQVIGLPEGKDKEGNRLSKQCWKPRPAWSKKQLAGLPLDQCGPKWFDDKVRLARNAAYNAADVRVSREMDKRIPELEPAEWDIWQHVWDMNLRGLPVDVEMIHGAIAISEETIRDVSDRIRSYTSGMVQSLKAPGQLVAWAERYGYFMPSWTKDTVQEALSDPKCPEPVRVVALARQEASRGSVAKFEKAADMVSLDGTLKHQLLYAGTSTLRLAGRGVQPLNLPRPKIMADQSAALADVEAGRPVRVATWKLDYDPERALAAIKAGDLSSLRNMGDPEEILSDNLRSMIVAPAGQRLASPDLSAIEARGVFWLVNCEKALDVYRRGGDLYCEFASIVVGHPVNKKDHPEIRQNYGKVPVLSCGYGAGAAKVALTNKIDEEVAYRGVTAYRREYSEVPNAWRELENAAIEAIRNPGYLVGACAGRVHFISEAGWLRMRRPSGTWMYMPDAGVDFEGRLFYHTWIKGGWREESIWGGVLINFVVQGMCRELMYSAEMRLAQDPQYDLFLQCYDSLTAAVQADQADALCTNMIREMTTPPPWCPDFPLAAEGKPKDRYS
jgi:DNA polymerase